MMSNKVTNKAGWYISYLPGKDIVDDMFDALVGIETPAGGETAITSGNGYLILVGDWQEAYSKCDTFEQAVGVYKANIDKRSPWSEDWDIVDTVTKH